MPTEAPNLPSAATLDGSPDPTVKSIDPFRENTPITGTQESHPLLRYYQATTVTVR
jgi:hypothetical protein